MKILIASILPVKDMSSWSGISNHIFNQLDENHDVVVCYSAKAHRNQKRLAKMSVLLFRLFGKRLNVYFNKDVAQQYGKELNRMLKEHRPDLMVCLGSGTELAFVNTSVKSYLVADACFSLLEKGYPLYQKLSPVGKHQSRELEATSFQKFDRLYFTSKWAIDACTSSHPSCADKTRLINFGSNVPIPQDVPIRAMPTDASQIKLLTIGTDYERKGMDRAEALRAMLDCQLTIIGTDQQLNKSVHQDIEKLCEAYAKHDFFILFSRYDCTPIVINEASGFGLPIIAWNTGGIPEIVQSNGIVVDNLEEAKLYIETTLKNNDYSQKSTASRTFYEKNLTWELFESKLLE